jgi:hypothetical protein
MFAIDGVKLPSNASKAKSGTRADFAHQADKLEAAAKKMLERHRENDRLPNEPDLAEKSRQRAESLNREAANFANGWLPPSRQKGSKGTLRKSNRTDPESAKMATGKGVIQGYTGVAAVDARHQIIIEAQAHGTGSEQELLLPVVRASQAHATPDTLYTADAGYHSESNLKALAEEQINALIADNGMRQRDERFKDQGKHKAKPDPLYDKAHPKKAAKRYRPKDFTSIRQPASASVRPASSSTATAPTASTTATSPPNTAAPSATACPASNGTNVCAPRRRRKSGKLLSSGVKPIQPKKATPTG